MFLPLQVVLALGVGGGGRGHVGVFVVLLVKLLTILLVLELLQLLDGSDLHQLGQHAQLLVAEKKSVIRDLPATEACTRSVGHHMVSADEVDGVARAEVRSLVLTMEGALAVELFGAGDGKHSAKHSVHWREGKTVLEMAQSLMTHSEQYMG